MLKLVIETDEVSFSVHFFNEVMLACLTFYNSILFPNSRKSVIPSRCKAALNVSWMLSG